MNEIFSNVEVLKGVLFGFFCTTFNIAVFYGIFRAVEFFTKLKEQVKEISEKLDKLDAQMRDK